MLLLVGNGTEAVKMVEIAAGSLVIGNAENGVAGLQGTALYIQLLRALRNSAHSHSQLVGTGATNAAGARTNLDVYSKAETDEQISESTSVAYTTTLSANGWTLNGDMYTQNIF